MILPYGCSNGCHNLFGYGNTWILSHQTKHPSFSRLYKVRHVVHKAKLAKLDINPALSTLSKLLNVETRPLSRADVDQILKGKEVNGYTFAGKANSKSINGAEVGFICVRDTDSGDEFWLGVVKKQDTVFSSKRLNPLEWKIGTALSGAKPNPN